MHLVDTLALVGEVLSWIGLGVGIPFLIVALLIRLVEGQWVPVEVAVIDRDGRLTARWFAGGDFHERPLRRGEPTAATVGWLDGFHSSNDPARIRIGEPPHLRRVLRTVGIVFAAVGAVGLIVSFLPLVL
ncbi:hypothetical protein [Microbacterium sp. KSW4-4]|uniref:hypothetical protein n=1 Tax=Microbacterium sp. KSW4-4 TaxID=2851651 RepID=UPI001FFC52C6|nr:hypothetical protein [Microbacterium sp. KSW4-4]MCK2032777.1 hypothetical protein [Microbacterium sp. KSW4-4]